MSDQLVAETSTWQHSQQTNFHAPGGIRTHNLSRRDAADPRFRQRGHWYRQCNLPDGYLILVQLNISLNITYSMVQSPSWETNWSAASQEIPPISRNPKVHYGTHKRPPPVSILGQPNPVHIPTSHLVEIHPNIIHPSTPRSPQWSPSLQFPQQDPIHPPLLTHTRHMPRPSHSSRFYHPHNIGWGVQYQFL